MGFEEFAYVAAADIYPAVRSGDEVITYGAAANIYVPLDFEVIAYGSAADVYFATPADLEVIANGPAGDVYFAAIGGIEASAYLTAVRKVELSGGYAEDKVCIVSDRLESGNVWIWWHVDNVGERRWIRRPDTKNLSSNRRARQN